MSDIHMVDYRELNPGNEREGFLILRDCISDQPHPDVERIIRYLDQSPAYCGVGKGVGDVLDPSAKVILFLGIRTDGMYFWPAVLSYYVRKYHVKLPAAFVERMRAVNWQPPGKGSINWDELFERVDSYLESPR